jgi:hypothetical protein
MESPVEEHPDTDSEDRATASVTNTAASNLCELIFVPPNGARRRAAPFAGWPAARCHAGNRLL